MKKKTAKKEKKKDGIKVCQVMEENATVKLKFLKKNETR